MQMLRVGDRRVTIRAGATFGCISPEDFITELAKKVKPNNTCWTSFSRMHVPPGVPLSLPDSAPITSVVMVRSNELIVEQYH